MKWSRNLAKYIQIPEFAFGSLGLAFGLVGVLNRQVYAKAIEPLGITDQQLFILTTLENLGAQVQAHLSEPLNIDKATMVGLINDLVAKGLVERQPHPTDRRAVLVVITDAGREKMRQGFAISDEFTQKFFKGLSQQDQENLSRILKILADNTVALAAEYGDSGKAGQ
jgi:DNA-binding MarR family transcriptional regulator